METPVVDGVAQVTTTYGPATRKAVQMFQAINDIEIDGCVGESTYDLLMSENAKGMTLKRGLDATLFEEDVTKLQNRLIELGYMTDTAHGALRRHDHQGGHRLPDGQRACGGRQCRSGHACSCCTATRRCQRAARRRTQRRRPPRRIRRPRPIPRRRPIPRPRPTRNPGTESKPTRSGAAQRLLAGGGAVFLPRNGLPAAPGRRPCRMRRGTPAVFGPGALQGAPGRSPGGPQAGAAPGAPTAAAARACSPGGGTKKAAACAAALPTFLVRGLCGFCGSVCHVGQQSHDARALDGDGQVALVLGAGRRSCGAA